jgi:predicted thioesterase
VYATQSLSFRAPVLVGQAVTAEVTLTRITGRKASFDTRVRVFSDKHQGSESAAAVAVDGKALALLPPGSETRKR